MADGGDEAANALNGQDFKGRNLTVNEARPREPRDNRGGGGGGYGGGAGGGGRSSGGGGWRRRLVEVASGGGYGGGGGGRSSGGGGGGTVQRRRQWQPEAGAAAVVATVVVAAGIDLKSGQASKSTRPLAMMGTWPERYRRAFGADQWSALFLHFESLSSRVVRNSQGSCSRLS